jgi:hypothetical protein
MDAVTAFPTQRLVLLDDVLDAYGDTYAKRSRVRGGRVFERDEPNSLVALWLSVVARDAKRPPRDDVVEALTQLTSTLLTEAGEHTLSTDITGVAWADAYGVLPVERPPIEQVTFVLLSGAPQGSVHGLLRSAWRSLFLATALPMLNWQHRPAAIAELRRWVAYLQPKVEAIDAEASELSVTARVAFVLGELARRTADAELAVRASDLLRSVAPPEDSWPALTTAQLAYVASAAAASGMCELHTSIVGHLLDERVGEKTRLLTVAHEEVRDELTPWVPLALALTDRREKPEVPRPRGLVWRWRR